MGHLVFEELERSFADDPRWMRLPWFTCAWQCSAENYDDALRTQCSALNKSYALRFQELAYGTDVPLEKLARRECGMQVHSTNRRARPWCLRCCWRCQLRQKRQAGAAWGVGGGESPLARRAPGALVACEVQAEDLLLDLCAAPGVERHERHERRGHTGAHETTRPVCRSELFVFQEARPWNVSSSCASMGSRTLRQFSCKCMLALQGCFCRHCQ